MKSLDLKKVLTAISTLVVCLGVYFGYEYVTEPKIVDGVLAKGIDEKGKPIEISSTFAPKDTVYFAAKQNRFWINKAQVRWYKGEIAPQNRFLVEEDVTVNKGKYFTTELSIPEGLEEGIYGVTIYVKDKDVIETKVQFEVKK